MLPDLSTLDIFEIGFFFYPRLAGLRSSDFMLPLITGITDMHHWMQHFLLRWSIANFLQR
jgi:hypothetical protein